MNEPAFETLIDQEMAEIRQLLLDRRRDYGPANILEFEERGIVLRSNDKMSRLKNLTKPGRTELPRAESIDDTWRDLAGYAILALILRHDGPERFANAPLLMPKGAGGVVTSLAINPGVRLTETEDQFIHRTRKETEATIGQPAERGVDPTPTQYHEVDPALAGSMPR